MASNASCAPKENSRSETMANAVEASASTARPRKLKKGAAQGETAAARRDGVQQGNCQRTKKGESSRLPKNEHLTGTLEQVTSNRQILATLATNYKPTRTT